ncbi:MAG: S8 family serine peptidase [Desulfurococcaceae archaeon]|nr:S8 family serine peptidase [Sulfolobales archaeon]MDW8170709.1 S8 family serine peptidase [Desulfurococcaceae archaeon]
MSYYMRYLSIFVLIAVVCASLTPLQAIAVNSSSYRAPIDPLEKISLELLNEYYSVDEAKVISADSVGWGDSLAVNVGFNACKPVLIAASSNAIGLIKSTVAKLKYYIPLPNGVTVAYAMASRDQVLELAKNPYVYSILPSPRIDELLGLSNDRLKAMALGEERAFEASQSGSGLGLFSGLKLQGVVDAWREYNVSGRGVVVGVVDTGIDYSNPELGLESLARDLNGLPMTIVMDEHLALTKNIAVRNATGYLNTSGAVVVYFSTMYSGYYGVLGLYATNITIDWYVGNLTSLSRVYKFGLFEWFFQDGLTGYYVRVLVPTVLVDTTTPGVYDAVVFDLSTAFYLLSTTMRSLEIGVLGRAYWRAPDPLWLDYSFADEPVFKFGGRELVGRDFDGDGILDFSLGVISGYYFDSYGLAKSIVRYPFVYLSEPGVYVGLDPRGEYVALFTDYHGHGTSVATVIGARGNLNYTTPYYGGTVYKLYGVAPRVKIAGGTGFWFGDLIPPEYWLAGWNWVYDPELEALYPVPAGVRRADVVSNSWAYINLAKWAHQAQGMDYMSAVFGQIVAVNMLIGHNATLVFAAGNYGPGYTTISAPGADLLIIEVAASTLFEYFQVYAPSYVPGYADDIVPFSSRGPNALGYPKPDVAAIGAWEMAGVRTINGRGYGVRGYNEGFGPGLTLFGGTSESTPFTSGMLALAIEACLSKYGYIPSPVELKVLAKSSADDLGYPGLQQGSGRMNAYKLVKAVIDGGFKAYVLEGVQSAFIENYLNLYGWFAYYIASMLVDTAYYAVIPPGGSSEFTLVVEGRGNVSLSTTSYTAVRELTLFSGVYRYATMFLRVPKWLISDADYVEVYVAYQNVSYSAPYYRMNPPSNEYMIRVDVFDYYGDKYYRLNTEARTSTVAMITVGSVRDRIKGDLVVRLRPSPYITAATPPVLARVVVRTYRETPSTIIQFTPRTLSINGSAVVRGVVNVPRGFAPGVYEYKVKVATPSGVIVLPVTLVVPAVIDGTSKVLLGATRSRAPYDSYTPLGLADPVNSPRTEAIDWRIVPFIVTEGDVSGVLMAITWSSGAATSPDVLVVPPGGAFLPTGLDQSFAAYKLAARVGFVYNPSSVDQMRGVLRLYAPVKWSIPLRYTEVLYFYTASPTPTSMPETVYPMPVFKTYALPGLYRVMIAYNSYSGLSLFDSYGLSLVPIKASQEVVANGDGSYSIKASFIAPSYGPLLGSSIYVFSDGYIDVPSGTFSEAVLGVYRLSRGPVLTQVNVLTYPGFFLKIGVGYNKVDVAYNVVVYDAAEIETSLVLREYVWHASGYYYYNSTIAGLVISEYLYPAVVTVSTVLEPPTS